MKFHWKDPLEPTVKVCPKCGGKLGQTSSMSGWMTPEYYYCEKCGYKGSVYVEIDAEDYMAANKKDTQQVTGSNDNS
ncbi:MAG: hypothetical protein JRN19_02330 [Nitrososphaerota archaeon]|nr:hypothetical protein [Nitrososphaerota archaeon]MDG7051272.1 hypothetical protein [Nitrososphaerota archaeon]